MAGLNTQAKKYSEPNMPLWAKAFYIALCAVIMAISGAILYWSGYAILALWGWSVAPSVDHTALAVGAIAGTLVLIVPLVVAAPWFYFALMAILWALGLIKVEERIPAREEAADLIDEFAELKWRYSDDFDDLWKLTKSDDPLLRSVGSEFLEVQRDYEENAKMNNGALSQENLHRLRELSAKLRAEQSKDCDSFGNRPE